MRLQTVCIGEDNLSQPILRVLPRQPLLTARTTHKNNKQPWKQKKKKESNPSLCEDCHYSLKPPTHTGGYECSNQTAPCNKIIQLQPPHSHTLCNLSHYSLWMHILHRPPERELNQPTLPTWVTLHSKKCHCESLNFTAAKRPKWWHFQVPKLDKPPLITPYSFQSITQKACLPSGWLN